jgi:transcriptional regulator with XRE-family HTH domain
MTTYGGYLRQLREKHRLSQQEVADFIDIAQSTYSLWESDKYSPQVEYLPKLAEILKVDIQELLPLATSVKIVNNTDNKDNSVNGFEVRVEGKELIKELLESKDEIIRMLTGENKRLKEENALLKGKDKK